MLGAALVLVIGAQSATAATYTWLNTSLTPNGSWRYEPSSARGFSRTGVAAQMPNADGAHWSTTAQFGSYYSTGDTYASVKGPRSFLATKARFTFEPGGLTSEDRTAAKAWLLDAVLSGTSSPPVDSPAPEATASDLRRGDVEGVELQAEGSDGTNHYWSSTDEEGNVCLFVMHGEYVGTTCTDEATFSSEGLTQTLGGPDLSIQAALVPGDVVTEKVAASNGLERVSSSVMVNTDAPIDRTLVISTPDQDKVTVDINK